MISAATGLEEPVSEQSKDKPRKEEGATGPGVRVASRS